MIDNGCFRATNVTKDTERHVIVIKSELMRETKPLMDLGLKIEGQIWEPVS